jgi:phytoene dehydrogenase-like protein
MNTEYDVIIVGGGHNGLVAACYLAKAGKEVILLEKNSEFGGATKSSYTFPGVAAKLSRYSYLVALLPEQIIRDLELGFETLSRNVSSYTPYDQTGVLINRIFDDVSARSIDEVAGFVGESESWQAFCSRIGEVAKLLAPTLLEPLKEESEIRSLLGQELWGEFVEQPLAHTLNQHFKSDLIKGIVLTDGLIGTFTSAEDQLANICFLYHLIGNGSGEWRVPKGGMGALVSSLVARAEALGVELRTKVEVERIESGSNGVTVVSSNGESFKAKMAIAGCSPKRLEKLSGIKAKNGRDGCQIKINMVLSRLPRLKSGIDPKLAFAGTFHIDEKYEQLEVAYQQAKLGQIPDVIPAEMYCHTLTDPSILSDEMQAAGNHTLTLFALHTPASLFDLDHDRVKAEVTTRILRGLNKYLAEPIEPLLLKDKYGHPCIEVKTPQELEAELDLPRGNIFHGDLSFPWRSTDEVSRWGVETSDSRILLAGAGSKRGGGVSGIGGHNAAMAALERI